MSTYCIIEYKINIGTYMLAWSRLSSTHCIVLLNVIITECLKNNFKCKIAIKMTGGQLQSLNKHLLLMVENLGKNKKTIIAL